MDKKYIALTLCIVCAILTIAMCVQIKTIENANSTVSHSFSDNSLRDEVLKWKTKYDEAVSNLDSAEKQLSKIRERATQNDTSSLQIEEEISINNNLIGITDIEGQGIEITVKDDPTATRETIGVLDDISKHIVHDADLRALVNELKNAGAEAISINEQRIVNTTAITCIGNVIKVNDEKITSPFTIKAIGFTESLAGIDRPGGYIEDLRDNGGIVVTIKKSNNVKIAKYTGAISAKYMKITQ